MDEARAAVVKLLDPAPGNRRYRDFANAMRDWLILNRFLEGLHAAGLAE